MRSTLRLGLLAGAAFGALALANPAEALPAGWTCVGNCGTAAPNGDVPAPPAFGPNYYYISTTDAPPGGPDGPASLGIGAETNGSLLTTSSFALAAGDKLSFYFNYITSDGAGYIEYAWAALDNLGTSEPNDIILFTARTTPTGDTVPGFGLPGLAPGVTLTPATTPIDPGKTNWAQLGGSSGSCYDAGCGSTGWISMQYTIPDDAAGSYRLRFGVVNWADSAFDSGMAIAGATINDVPIDPPTGVPGPAALGLFGLGLLGLAAARRRR